MSCALTSPNDNMFFSVPELILLSVFSDADRYEMQAASMASPMKSPHRYSPSVYSHQVACTSHLYHFFPEHQYLDSLFVTMILVYKLTDVHLPLVVSFSEILFIFKTHMIEFYC